LSITGEATVLPALDLSVPEDTPRRDLGGRILRNRRFPAVIALAPGLERLWATGGTVAPEGEES